MPTMPKLPMPQSAAITCIGVVTASYVFLIYRQDKRGKAFNSELTMNLRLQNSKLRAELDQLLGMVSLVTKAAQEVAEEAKEVPKEAECGPECSEMHRYDSTCILGPREWPAPNRDADPFPSTPVDEEL